MSLKVKPYEPLENASFPQVTQWTIEATDLANVVLEEGKTVFTFLNCKFGRIAITNLEFIAFGDISIYFHSCFIESIVVEEIVTKTISIGFSSSILSGKIKSPSLASVDFNNCIIRDNFFLLDIPKIFITYTEDNILCDGG